MAFTKYSELPEDVRLMIIDEAIEVGHQIYWNTGKPSLFLLSSVNQEWNKAVEMRLFNMIRIKPSSLSDFAVICGKRHRRLRKITLCYFEGEDLSGVQQEDDLGDAIARLFDIMKDWSHVDRERQGLIDVGIETFHPRTPRHPDPNIYLNLGGLPEVSIIGALHEVPSLKGRLHPSSSLCLYQRLPNVHHVTLNLPFRGDIRTSLQQASNTISSLGTMQPGLRILELTAGGVIPKQPNVQDAWLPAEQCIAAFPPCWHNSLVQLDLNNVNNLPRLLAEAGKILWPNLKRMSLFGRVNSHHQTKNECRSAAKRSCTDLVQGLITMLPSTPTITAILIEMCKNSRTRYSESFLLEFYLGNPDYWMGNCTTELCTYDFVPTWSYGDGVVVAAGTDFSGHLATELQHTVRRHLLKDLGVFFYYNDRSTWGSGRLCWQWDSDMGCWNAAFTQEADEFIYQMGQYIDWTESM